MKRIIIRKALLRDQRSINKLVTKYMGSICTITEDPKRNKLIPFMFVYNLNKEYVNEITDRFFLAVDSDTSEIIGCCALKDMENGQNCRSLIMAIETEYRNIGIGTKLLNLAQKEYKGDIICSIPLMHININDSEIFLNRNDFIKVKDIMQVFSSKDRSVYLPFKEGYKYYKNPECVIYIKSHTSKLI